VAHVGGPDDNSPSPDRVAELVESLALVMRQSALTELDPWTIEAPLPTQKLALINPQNHRVTSLRRR
jgi:hypothetical protein